MNETCGWPRSMTAGLVVLLASLSTSGVTWAQEPQPIAVTAGVTQPRLDLQQPPGRQAAEWRSSGRPARTSPGAPSAREPRLELAVASGVSQVRWEAGSLLGVGFDARVGWRLIGRVSVGAEFGFYGLNDETPKDSDVVVVPLTSGLQPTYRLDRTRYPKVAQTRTWLGYVQFRTRSGFFVRPGFGLGFQSFAMAHPVCSGFDCPGVPVYRAEEGAEGGFAVSAAVGWEWRLTKRFGLAAEGVFISSGGEDSTGGRTIFGVHVSPVVRF